LLDAAARLREAGVESFTNDARQLLAHVLQLEPSRLLLVDTVDDPQLAAFTRLVIRRADRVPLQHLTGTAYFRHEQIQVGPGVFVPRPETEVLTGWAVERLRALVREGRSPLVVELCAGSGAISKALVSEVPGLRVHAVEVSEDAADWALRNLAATGVELHVTDMAGALPELDGMVDLVVANPPYIPLDAYEYVAPEARDHDPAVALFSGDDGLDAMRVVARVAARLLRDGGLVGAEHADVQGESAPALFTASGSYGSVRDHQDLAGRPRFVTAVRRPRHERGVCPDSSGKMSA
jgi:release factor glutamine methyltransferase